MASVISTTPRLEISPSTTQHFSRWPSDGRVRALLALALSTPYIILATIAYGHGFSDSANSVLHRRSTLIHWGSTDLSFVGHIYPPLPTAIASLLPNPMALGIVGALAAGGMLEAVGHRLGNRGYPVWAVLLLLAALGASPSFSLTATTDLASFMSLMFLALALDGFMRFVFLAQTHGGFQAGLAIGIAGLCDPVAIIFALGFAASAPLIASQRYRAERHAGRATAAVLLFPTVAGIAGWTFLCWRFGDSPLTWLHQSVPALWTSGGSLHSLSTAATQLGRTVLLTPIFLAAVVLLASRRRVLSAVGICLPVLSILIAKWIGVPFSGLSVAIVLGIVGLVSLPAKPSSRVLTVIITVALLGIAAKWSYPPSATVVAWEHALGLR